MMRFEMGSEMFSVVGKPPLPGNLKDSKAISLAQDLIDLVLSSILKGKQK